MATDSTPLIIKIQTGTGEPPAMRITPGSEIGPISLGTVGAWRIVAPHVTEKHAYLFFDGERLYLQSLAAETPVMVDGQPVPSEWTEVRAPCEIGLGDARLLFDSFEEQVSMSPQANSAPLASASSGPVRGGAAAIAPSASVSYGAQAAMSAGGAAGISQPPFQQGGGRDALETKTEDLARLPANGARGPAPDDDGDAPTAIHDPLFPIPGSQPGAGGLPVSMPAGAAPHLRTGPLPIPSPNSGPPLGVQIQVPVGGPPVSQAPNLAATGPTPPGLIAPGPNAAALTTERGKHQVLIAPVKKSGFNTWPLPRKLLVIIGPVLVLGMGGMFLVRSPRSPLAHYFAKTSPTSTAATTAPTTETPPPADTSVPDEPTPDPIETATAAGGAGVGGAAPTTTVGQTPPPPPPSKPGSKAAPTAKSLEREAADALAGGEFEKAAEIYDKLAAEHPDKPVYAQAAEIVRQKIR